jgi:hypothetical protein
VACASAILLALQAWTICGGATKKKSGMSLHDLQNQSHANEWLFQWCPGSSLHSAKTASPSRSQSLHVLAWHDNPT